MKEINIVKIQRFSTHDGPGIRTVVFFKGCPLKCEWCHNPETQKTVNQIFYHQKSCIGCGYCADICKNNAHFFDDGGKHVFDNTKCKGCLECTECPTGAIEGIGKRMSVEEILNVVLRDRAFYGENGGLTVSGGEPMLQSEACIELLKRAKQENITTAVETCGYFDEKYVKPLTEVCDTILWDVKDTNTERHKQYTGVGNERIIKNLLLADKTAKNIVMRCIIVEGVNSNDEHIAELINIYKKLTSCSGIELIPYHAYAGSKAQDLGYKDNGRVDWIPEKGKIEELKACLREQGVTAI